MCSTFIAIQEQNQNKSININNKYKWHTQTHMHINKIVHAVKNSIICMAHSHKEVFFYHFYTIYTAFSGIFVIVYQGNIFIGNTAIDCTIK